MTTSVDETAASAENSSTTLQRSTDPSTVRPRLAEAAAESVDDIQRTLLDAATAASKPAWVEFECTDCGNRKRVEVPVPAVRARVAAIELLLREGLGRAPQAEDSPTPRMPNTVEEVRKMSWDDLQALFAATHVDAIAAAVREGGAASLRPRVAALDDGERRILREALAEVSA